jgi:hypothetical protein
MTQKELEIEPEETVFYFAFVCKGTLKAYEKIKQTILKTEDCELRFQTKSPVKLWIVREGLNEVTEHGKNR